MQGPGLERLGLILKSRVSTVKIKIKDSYHGTASNDMHISILKNLLVKFPLEKGVWLNLYQNASTVSHLILTRNPE